MQLTRSVVKLALRGMGQGAGVHGLSVGIIALSLTALGAAGLVVLQVSRVADAWNQERVVTVFLKPAATAPQVEALLSTARANPSVLDARHVGLDEARARLRQALGERADLLQELGGNVVPQAVEAELVPGTPVEVGRMLAESLGAQPGVDEASWGGEELGRLEAVVGVLRAGALLLAALIALVSVLVISNTLKLTVLARREEIEIMRLVGAGDVFVRSPFVLEGAVQGLGGSLLAGAMLLGLHSLLAVPAERVLSSAFGPVNLGGMPWDVVLLLVALGTALGVLGGLVGVSRFLRV